jgi:hypothetical protein
MGSKPKIARFRRDELKTFWYWINERHSIYLKRKNRKPAPWTKDLILQTYKFTNPFRQLDRVTQEWANRYCSLLGGSKISDKDKYDLRTPDGPSDGDILFHCAMFRLFNWPQTYDALHYMGKWTYDRAIRTLEARKAEGHQIFTGAYIIPNMGLTNPKIDIIAGAVDLIYENRKAFAAYIRQARSMEKTVEVLQIVPTIGPFIAYEIACDLRFTRVLSDATDIMCWANPGPGAMRGIHRLLTGSPKATKPRPDYVAHMRDLLSMAPKHLSADVKACEWPFEMREVEHSLCEFDKYMRVKNGEGRPRSRFKPEPPPPWEELNTLDKSTIRVNADEHEAAVKKFLAKKRRKKS